MGEADNSNGGGLTSATKRIDRRLILKAPEEGERVG
jgi:hypothetical protein